MSLSKLPESLIAQIGSFLDFKDIRNLMKVNKRINRTMKSYRLDKPKCWKLCLQYRSDEPTVSVLVAFTDKDPEYTRKEDFQQNDENIYEKYVETVEKFISMDSLIFTNIHLTEDLANRVINLTTSIDLFWLEHAELKISKETFIKLCKRFKNIQLKNVTFDLDEIVTDEVFCEIIKFTKISITSAHSLLALQFMSRQIIKNVALTDELLKEMEKILPDTLFLEYFATDFTMKGIKSLFEKGIKDDFQEDVFWNFGVLKFAEDEAVDEFIHDIDQGKYPDFSVEGTVYNDFYTYTIKHRAYPLKFAVVFSVYREIYEREINANSDDDSDMGIDPDLSDFDDMFSSDEEQSD